MSICLRRREFIAALGGAAAAWPLAVSAQQTKPTIGWLTDALPLRDSIEAFRRGLAEIGFLEGRDVTVDLVPAADSIAILAGPANRPANQAEARNVQSAARTLGLRLLLFNATTESEIAAAFAALVERQAQAVLLGISLELVTRTDQIISLAARYALPTMFLRGSEARAGGLSSYGPVLSESYRIIGAYTGRILKGEKPGDLPVQLPTRFELIINLKTARALGLEIPPLLLALADEVIE
jgi:putative ABC transport system substrate-binding protein